MTYRKRTLLLVIAMLATLTLGCGLLDSLTKKATDAGSEIVSQGKATLEAAVTQAAPTAAPSGGTAQGAAAPTTAPTQAAPATSAPADGDTLDMAALTAMEELDSFRMTAVISWTRVLTDGTSESGAMEMLNETDRASQSTRFRMSGQWPDMTGGTASSQSSAMEMIQIANAMYMSTGDGEWMAMQMSIEDMQDQFGWESDPRDFARGTGTFDGVERNPVNGYSGAKRYVYGESNVGGLGFGQVDEAQSTVWVADVGQGANRVTAIVKVDTTWSGTEPDGTKWLGGMQVDVTDINQPVTIEAPEGVGAPGMPADVPIMEGATKVQSMMGINTYTIAATADDVIGFYDEEMEANGWETEDSGIPTMVTYTKGNRQAILMVEEKDGVTEVTIMITE